MDEPEHSGREPATGEGLVERLRHPPGDEAQALAIDLGRVLVRLPERA